MTTLKIVSLSLIILFQIQIQARVSTQNPSQFSVMAYNVENLFDTIKDKDRLDDSYRPISDKSSVEHKARCSEHFKGTYLNECLKLDWSPEVVEEKLKRVADTITQVENKTGPDILILEEVENLNILNQLNQKLPQANYQTIELIEGFDTRGIDVAVMSRFKKISSKIHPIILNKIQLDTRGILEVNLQIDPQTTITVLAVHMPSQANPKSHRQAAIKTLNQIMLSKPQSQMVIAGGDFNISDAESDLFENDIGQYWQVSHLDGCDLCEGTYYHSNKWGFLDALLFKLPNKKFAPKFEPDLENISVIKTGQYQLGPKGTPQKFNYKNKVGVSDHLPIFATLYKY